MNEQRNLESLRRLQQVWGAYAKTDPLGAIVSSADKKGGRWDSFCLCAGFASRYARTIP